MGRLKWFRAHFVNDFFASAMIVLGETLPINIAQHFETST